MTTARWAAVAYGLVALGPDRTLLTWTDVFWIAVCVFLTTLRTLMPLHLGDHRPPHRWIPFVDIAVFSVAAGWTGATSSPWFFCTLVALGVLAFGWGARGAMMGGLLAVVIITVATPLSGDDVTSVARDLSDALAALALAVVGAGAVLLRTKAVQAATAVRMVQHDVASLRTANELLEELSRVALSLPGAFTLRDALGRIRLQLAGSLEPQAIALLTLDEQHDEWTPKITDHCAMRAAYEPEELPEVFREVLETEDVVHRGGRGGRPPSSWLGAESSSGLYLPLRARGRIIGLLGMEHPSADHFDGIDPTLRDGLGDVIALTVDNARWFGRLRSLGAEEERIRVARDIHDRIGQWMTFIKMELERLSRSDAVDRDELRRLERDANEALDELRETLRQLRTGVSDDRPLSVLGTDLAQQFSARTHIPVDFHVADAGQRLPIPVENELLRILQEALNNVDRHADAQHVEVEWVVDGGNFALTVADDGRGFDPDNAVREQSYGVVGMRERADVIGASFDLESSPGRGTRLCVRAGRSVPSAVAAGRP